MTTAQSILNAAAGHMQARAATYDKPEGERSMGKAVQAFNAITGRGLSEAEGWLLLAVLKNVRLFQRPGYHADSAEDAVAYGALLAEAKARELEQPGADAATIHPGNAVVPQSSDGVPYIGPDRRKAAEPATTEQSSVADADGWIKWEGGECPVGPLEGIRVIYRNHCTGSGLAGGAGRWTHDGSSTDIIAYRLSKEASHG